MTADATPQLRHVIALWGALRVGLGTAALVAPRAASAVWVGSALPEPTRAVLGRALGGRDLALGAGTVVSAMTGGSTTPWIVASGGADAVDAAATVAAWSQLPPGRRELVGVASAGSALTAAVLASLSRRAGKRPDRVRKPAG
ncbi:MAG: hypothetical protein GEV09_13685 [Pseudonocardiaceae bacterium]|nr:hypothetical protein [Pseudonocardiaceae bacterium]